MHVPVNHAVCNGFVSVAVHVRIIVVVHNLTVSEAEESEVDKRNVLRFGLREHLDRDTVESTGCNRVEIIAVNVTRVVRKCIFLRRGDRSDDVAVFVKQSKRAVNVFFRVEFHGVGRRAVCGVEVAGYARGDSAVVLRCRIERIADFGHFVEGAEVGQLSVAVSIALVGLEERHLRGIHRVCKVGIYVRGECNDDISCNSAETYVETVNHITVKEVVDDGDYVRSVEGETEKICNQTFDGGEQVVDDVEQAEIVCVEREVCGNANCQAEFFLRESVDQFRSVGVCQNLTETAQSLFQTVELCLREVACVDCLFKVEVISQDGFEQRAFFHEDGIEQSVEKVFNELSAFELRFHIFDCRKHTFAIKRVGGERAFVRFVCGVNRAVVFGID